MLVNEDNQENIQDPATIISAVIVRHDRLRHLEGSLYTRFY